MNTIKKKPQKQSLPDYVATEYPAPVSDLLKLGRPALYAEKSADYLALGLNSNHRSDLKALALDFNLFCQGDEPDVYGPIHAWRALGQLGHPDDIAVLVKVLLVFDDTDWASEELPEIFAQFGATALPALTELLADKTKIAQAGDWPRITAAECLPKIAKRHREARGECIRILTDQLKQHAHNSPEFNGFLVSNLLDMEASESLPTLDAAYTAGHVDESICGDLQEVRAEFGLRPIGQPPKPQFLGSKKFPFF